MFNIREIHVGDRPFHRGYHSYVYLNESVMVSKKPWLNQVLDAGIEVLIYTGNLDVIVHVPGTSAIVRSLRWRRRDGFDRSRRETFWVWHPDEARGRIAGYYNEGGGLVSHILYCTV